MRFAILFLLASCVSANTTTTICNETLDPLGNSLKNDGRLQIFRCPGTYDNRSAYVYMCDGGRWTPRKFPQTIVSEEFILTTPVVYCIRWIPCSTILQVYSIDVWLRYLLMLVSLPFIAATMYLLWNIDKNQPKWPPLCLLVVYFLSYLVKIIRFHVDACLLLQLDAKNTSPAQVQFGLHLLDTYIYLTLFVWLFTCAWYMQRTVRQYFDTTVQNPPKCIMWILWLVPLLLVLPYGLLLRFSVETRSGGDEEATKFLNHVQLKSPHNSARDLARVVHEWLQVLSWDDYHKMDSIYTMFVRLTVAIVLVFNVILSISIIRVSFTHLHYKPDISTLKTMKMFFTITVLHGFYLCLSPVPTEFLASHRRAFRVVKASLFGVQGILLCGAHCCSNRRVTDFVSHRVKQWYHHNYTCCAIDRCRRMKKTIFQIATNVTFNGHESAADKC